MRAVAFIVLSGIAGFCFAEDQKPAKLPPEVQEVVDLAMAAPPEFGANAILRLLDAGLVADRAAKVKLIDTAFLLGARAQHPYRMVAVRGIDGDTGTAYEATALRLNLDALSLQSRAVKMMLGLDPARAAEMYGAMPKPHPERLNCEASLIPDVSEYYALLGWLAQTVFTGPDGAKNSRLAFLQTALEGIRSHIELPPAAQLLATTDATPSQFEILSGTFAGKMQALGADDRAFSHAARELEPAITYLMARARQYNVRPERIGEAYRSYLVSNLSAARCADTGRMRGQLAGSVQELFGETVRGEMAPLTAEETKPKKMEGAPKAEAYWESAESKRLLEESLKLRRAPNGSNLSEAARNTREWRRQLGDYLTMLAGWGPGVETSEESYYHQKAFIYEALLELTPSGEARDRVVQDYVGFLKNSNVQSHDMVLWYGHARTTLNRVRAARPADVPALLAAFDASGNLVLKMESVLDRVAPAYFLFPN